MIEGLRCKITIQETSTEIDSIGNHTSIWDDYYTCHAYANGLSGSEYYAAKQINSEEEISFIIRYCEKVSALSSDKYRIIFNGDIYNISYIDNVQFKNKSLKIRAKKVKR